MYRANAQSRWEVNAFLQAVAIREVHTQTETFAMRLGQTGEQNSKHRRSEVYTYYWEVYMENVGAFYIALHAYHTQVGGVILPPYIHSPRPSSGG